MIDYSLVVSGSCVLLSKPNQGRVMSYGVQPPAGKDRLWLQDAIFSPPTDQKLHACVKDVKAKTIVAIDSHRDLFSHLFAFCELERSTKDAPRKTQ